MRRLARASLLCATLATAAASAWALAQNPFAAPLVERSVQGARAALTRAMAHKVTTSWLIERVEAALAAQDADALELYIELANDRGKPLPPELLRRALAFAESQQAFLTRAADCAACAADIANCKRLAQVAACAIPLEMTPLGDLNALRRAGLAWAAGAEVDRLDAGLALAGLGATGLAIGTGGASLPVKAGATLLRLARRADAITPAFARTLGAMAEGAVRWEKMPDYLAGRVGLEQVTDGAKLASLGAVAADLGRISKNTSPAETLTLMRHIDSAAEARAMARLSELQGPRTRHTIAALGKTRAFRLMLRISDMALLTVSLLTALALQIVSLLSGWMRRMVRPAPAQLQPPRRSFIIESETGDTD